MRSDAGKMNRRARAEAPVIRNAVMERILDCAEREFAARGYTATPLHRIASAAKVNQALINYYFRSKEKLYLAIFLRRGLELTRERLRLLEELESRKSAPLTVEELIQCFLGPAIKLMYQPNDGKAFLRLQARLQSEPKETTAKLRATVYDQATRRYIDRFQAALPLVDRKTIVWRMVMMIGAYLYIVSDPNRLVQLSDGACDVGDQEEVMRQLSAFMTGGFGQPIRSGMQAQRKVGVGDPVAG
ncbi:MAG: TetR family transcriptional regulator [Rhodospirillales bacterium]|nr:TetR family transcriptional regulator [Rhodospirillales bacterium]